MTPRESRRPTGERELRFVSEAARAEVAADVLQGGEVSTAFARTFGLSRAAGVMRPG